MDLNTLWFVLIAVLFIGFFFLEGFDYGVGILLPVLGKNDVERRGIINTIGPFWDANETWMVTAGGAMFAAFPGWYATLFSGFYLALALMLVGLILRGVGFEFRSKDPRPAWRNLWDVCIFIGSFVPALLWGVAFGNIVKGVPIDGSMNYTGGFFNLLNPYALVCGLAGLALFTLHGARFLILKGDHEIAGRARDLTKKLGPVAMLLLAGTFAMSFKATDLFARNASISMIVAAVGGITLLAAGLLSGQKRDGVAFAMTGVTIACSVVSIFAGLFPRVMISSSNPDWNLTITNASSSHYTLTIMSVVALMFVPVVLAYQIWTYWVFRQRVVTPASEKPA